MAAFDVENSKILEGNWILNSIIASVWPKREKKVISNSAVVAAAVIISAANSKYFRGEKKNRLLETLAGDVARS